MAQHPVPPPSDPPLAESAPALLTAFIYYTVRDLLPPRYLESIIAHVRAHPDAAGDKDLWAYAERKARELSYDPTAVGE